MFSKLVLTAATSIALLAIACSSSTEGGSEVQIRQTDAGCSPASVDVAPGERLTLVVKNDSGKDYEIEGIEGTELEEVIVPEGKTRNIDYNVPDKAGVYKLKCYVPGDNSTIIELKAAR